MLFTYFVIWKWDNICEIDLWKWHRWLENICYYVTRWADGIPASIARAVSTLNRKKNRSVNRCDKSWKVFQRDLYLMMLQSTFHNLYINKNIHYAILKRYQTTITNCVKLFFCALSVWNLYVWTHLYVVKFATASNLDTWLSFQQDNYTFKFSKLLATK